MRSRVETVGLRALNVLHVEAQVVGPGHLHGVHLPYIAPLNLPVVVIELPILFISPQVGWLQGVCVTSRLESHVFVDIFDIQPRNCIHFLGQLRRLASFHGLLQDLLPSIHPSLAVLFSDIVDLECIPNKFTARIHDNFRSGGQNVFGAKRIYHSIATELGAFGSCSFDVIDIQRIGGLPDLFAVIGDWFDVGGELKIRGGWVLGNMNFGGSSGDVFLLEGAFAVIGGSGGEILFS